MDCLNNLSVFAALGRMMEGTEFDKVFKETFDKSFKKYKLTEEPVKAFQKANTDAMNASIVKLPLINRVNFLLNSIDNARLSSDNPDSDIDMLIDWENINRILTTDINEFDYSCKDIKVSSYKELAELRQDMIAAANDLGPWTVRKCKDCKEEFDMNFSEVDYFCRHDLMLPKRCKTCRSLRKAKNSSLQDKTVVTNTEVKEEQPIFNSAMKDAMEKVGL